ncbi:pseudouridine synthase [Devosia sp. MC532]|uniref:pseudouridine synthase n=1 Tax=Devosia sp. MC532 TaxID=2799788 RepID=UPI0018F4B948|nr:pseudouridine synthase [Devosia sp. MC532]MBJ7577511.1 pseudouridine synthase [Devosia sp. MC532]
MSDTPKQPEAADRLAKVIARAGLCSRRDAEGWIADGRISVNGKKVITPAFNVTSRDKIEVDGLPLAARQGTRVWLYNKPAGLVVTEKDPEGRPTIFEALDRMGLPRVLTVGRLDINTEGLLLLTNDGGLKRVLELPATGWLRRYRVRAYGHVTQAQLDALKHGITVDGIQYGPITATLEREQGHNVWMVLGLREGKNREVKNVLGSLGLEVNRLIRVSYGPFQLGDLAEGGVEMVKSRMLRDQLGKKLAESAGVDFESEMPEYVPPVRDETYRVRSPRDRDHARPNPARGAPPRFGSRDEDRPTGRTRKVHFDDDGRAPEAYEPRAQERARFDRDDQPARSFGSGAPREDRGDRAPRGDKPFGDRAPRGDKPYGDRAPRGDKPFGDRAPRGDKPYGDRAPRGDKPYGDRAPRGDKPFGDRAPRGDKPFGDRAPRGDKPFGDRPKRDFGDRPQRSDRPFGDRPKRDFGDRPQRSERPSGERPARSFGDRPQRSDRPFGDRPQRSERPSGERPARGFGDRPQRSDRPFGDRPQRSERPSGDRPARSFGDRPQRSERPSGERPARGFADRPQRSDRPSNDRPQRDYGDRPQRSDRPARGDKPFGDRKPFGAKPFGAKPFGGKPGGARPAGGRPSNSRPSSGGPRPTGPRKPRG